ncbi:MAG: D-alanyl-D-alanine carboxypeptidase [Hyphomicrobiales bacterium]|nr:D-alanyl-D-alanine carboxypeptidase [Hyphomicrobiales bacterium]
MTPKQFGKAYFLIFRIQLLGLIILTFVTFGQFPKAALANSSPWILIDATTGNVIAHHQPNRPWHPASITKLMTAYTIFREIKSGNVDLNSPVRISSAALALPPSKMGLPVGTILNIDNALKMIMVKSANDVAAALAQSVGGSISNFAKLMNKSAKNLGMSGSHFSNPHGLHAEDQVTTARDMALLALAIQNEFPQYSHYFDISAIRFGKIRMKNHNALIYKFPGTNGMKTGYTCPSGLNIVARAQRNGEQLIVVVLGGYSSLERNAFAAKLLRQGFNRQFHNPIIPVVTHVKKLHPSMSIYAVPANLRTMICKPSWTERQLNKKQRRKRRKLHLAKLEILRDTYLNEAAKPGPAQKVVLGKATGMNPFKFKLRNGGTPRTIVATPAWRPDRSAPPYAEFE